MMQMDQFYGMIYIYTKCIYTFLSESVFVHLNPIYFCKGRVREK